MDADGFIVHVKAEDIYKDIAKDVVKRFDISSYEFERLLPKRNNKKVIYLMKDELGAKIMKEFVGLRAKKYSNSIDDCSKNKTTEGTKKYIIKRKLRFKGQKSRFQAKKLENKIIHLNNNKVDVKTLVKDYVEFIRITD